MIPSLFHNFNFIYIWWIADISPLSQCCSNDRQKGKWKNEDWRNRERKGIETWYFNFKPRNQILKFSQIYRIHNSWDLQKFCYQTWSISSVPQHEKIRYLWHLWGSIYEAKVIMYRSSHPEVFCKKVFLENMQNSQENTCAECLF